MSTTTIQTSRYPSIVAATFPSPYLNPFLQMFGQTPDATATGTGLGIMGTKACVMGGTVAPENVVAGFIGSIYMRALGNTYLRTSQVPNDLYLKISDDGGKTGWVLVMNEGNIAGAHQTTFGLEDDTVGQNTAAKYGNLFIECVPTLCCVTCVVLPTTDDAVFDVSYSIDQGYNWQSIFAPGDDTSSAPSTLLGQKVVFPKSSAPTTDPHRIEITSFAFSAIPDKAILRIDTLQSGGATGITIDVYFGPNTGDINGNTNLGGGGSGIIPLGL